MRTFAPGTTVGLCLSVLSLVPSAAFAQAWEVEAHGGGWFSSSLSGGTTDLPGSTSLNAGFGAPASRSVSSWLFGDGADLLNGVAAAWRFPSFPDRITPLDPVLASPLAERGKGGSFGFRVAREVTPRFTAEFNFDYNTAGLTMSDSTVSRIKASADSYAPVLRGILGPLATGTGSPLLVTSNSSVEDGKSSQIAATGALNINVVTQGRIIPYATVGAGVIASRGDNPSAQLGGNMSLDLFGIEPFDESDSVMLRYSIDDKRFVGVFGGGLKLFVNQRSGLRVDVRVHVGRHRVATILEADPNVATAPLSRADVLISATMPSIYFSNNPATGVQSSLSGPDVKDFTAYEARGTQASVVASVGYFFRF